MQTSEKVAGFIVEGLGWTGPREALTDDYPLLANGVIDSLGLFRIVEFIESEYGVEIPDDELLPENFETLGAINRLVKAHAHG